MKVKMNLYISNEVMFARNPESDCYSVSMSRIMDGAWTFVKELDVDVCVDSGAVMDKAKETLDKEIGKHTAAINVLENRKAELLALPGAKS